MTTALITRGMVCVRQVQVLLEGRPVLIQVKEVKPKLKKVEYTETTDDLHPRILKIEEQ